MDNNMSDRINTRLYVLETLIDIEKKHIFVKDAIHKLLFRNQFLSKQDRAFITRMLEGITEYQVRLDYVVNSYSKKPIEKCKPVIRAILRMGVYQMLFMSSVPNETACDECVKLAKKKGFRNLTGFVNGVLRSVARNIDNIQFPKENDDLEQYLSIKYSVPIWLVQQMIAWYGISNIKKIFQDYVTTKDITIRVNKEKISVDDMRQKLINQNIKVKNGNYIDYALHLEHINYVKRIKGFKEGEFFIQDESSMMVYEIANPLYEYRRSENNKLKILDLCAAPGGKTTHFSQMLKEKALIEARDVSEIKTELIIDNIQRLQLNNIETKVYDALILDSNIKDTMDIVLADLPCSGLGIVSKKNDIKYHLNEKQLLDLGNLQRNILANAATYVKPGGILIYSTCTINPKENIENAEWFLSHFSFEKENITNLVPDDLKNHVMDDYALQLLPGIEKCDGFFIAKFRRKS